MVGQYGLFKCDGWGGSEKLVGIYDDRTQLLIAVRKKVEQKEFVCKCDPNRLNELTPNEIGEMLEYAIIKPIPLNKEL